jgi:hypothetical protein
LAAGAGDGALIALGRIHLHQTVTVLSETTRTVGYGDGDTGRVCCTRVRRDRRGGEPCLPSCGEELTG